MSENSKHFWKGFLVGVWLVSLIGIAINEYRYYQSQQALNQSLEESIQKGRKDIQELEQQLDSIRVVNTCKQRPVVCSFIS